MNDSTIAILMCTYNGERFLEEQLMSFNGQTYKNWELYISDDNSTDDTKCIIERYSTIFSHNKIHFSCNPKRMGFSKNFLNLIKSSSDKFDFYAVSDQDDIWGNNKISRAISFLQHIPNHKPALYCSRTELINSQGEKVGLSPLFKKPPSFRNAIVQNIAGGNTMVLNHAAKKLINDAIKSNPQVVSHDWFIYQIISGSEGYIYYDKNSETYYRQHANNVIGSNTKFRSKLFRIRMMMNNSYKKWNDLNIIALERNANLLTVENKTFLQEFIEIRKKSAFERIRFFIKSKIHRQTLSGNLALIVGIVLNKI